MNPIARNALAVIIGFVVGGFVNMGLITIGMSLIPLPAGADMSNMAAVRESMKLLGPENFVIPILGHALGTLVGAFVATKLAVGRPMGLALIVGILFLLGGIAMILNCGGPLWFIITDLVVAYIPMALLGGTLAGGQKG
jgi:hypothetical protein